MKTDPYNPKHLQRNYLIKSCITGALMLGYSAIAYKAGATFNYPQALSMAIGTFAILAIVYPFPPFKKRGYAGLVFLLWVFVSASFNLMPTPPSTTSTPSEPSNQRSAHISHTQYGERWPFTIPEGVLKCTPATVAGYKQQHATITYHGKTYAINGNAESSGKYLPLASIWRDHPEHPDAKMPNDHIIKKALTLCK